MRRKYLLGSLSDGLRGAGQTKLARHSEPSLTMRYTHTRLEDNVRALEALPPVSSTAQNAGQDAVA